MPGGDGDRGVMCGQGGVQGDDSAVAQCDAGVDHDGAVDFRVLEQDILAILDQQTADTPGDDPVGLLHGHPL